jgi:hypothetical protein
MNFDINSITVVRTSECAINHVYIKGVQIERGVNNVHGLIGVKLMRSFASFQRMM